MEQCTTSSGHSERCSNPLCHNQVAALSDGQWRRTPRLFCSEICKQRASILHRAAVLLADLHPSAVLEALAKARSNGGEP
jgi:hypothetical protein